MENYGIINACKKGDVEIVKLLISKKVSTSFKDNQALVNACYFGHYHLVKMLLLHGADIHAQDNQALIDAAFKGHLKIVMLLVHNGADVHARCNEALYKAMNRGRREIAKFLIIKGASIENMMSIERHFYNDGPGSIIDYEDEETYQPVIIKEVENYKKEQEIICNDCNKTIIKDYQENCYICKSYANGDMCLCESNFALCNDCGNFNEY